MSTPYEWRIDAIEQKAERAVSRLYEIDSLRSELHSLEYTVRSLSACVDGLRSTCESLLQRIERLEEASQ